MISPLPNTTIIGLNDDRQQRNSSTFITNRPNIPKSQTPVVSFGPQYQDMQQTSHFEHEYNTMLLDSIPPLITYQPPQPSRVGVIPCNIKRSPIIPRTSHETTTLTKKLEPPPVACFKKSTSQLSVFSGPHYLPEKYSIKPMTTFRQMYFVPNYQQQQPSRYFVTPHINHYFQAALQDGSYFDSYTSYKASDPVNFRHAYGMEQPNNSLDATENRTRSSTPPAPPVRKWHKPIESITSSNNVSSSEEDDDDDDDDEDDDQDSEESIIFNPSNKGKERETPMIIDEPSITTPPQPLPLLPSKRILIKPPQQQKRKAYSPSPPPLAAPTPVKKQKMKSFIPTKKGAIEELRQLGKFIKAWKHKDPEVCCVCYEDTTTQANPLVYCDNALCDVIVHKNCYKIKSNISNAEHWYCDRCTPVGGVSVHREVTCAVCPSITGAFCKLTEPFHGIEWVHMICAKMLTGPGGFTYQAKTNDYKMLIRHHIPIQRFISKCIYCTDTIFADFGAKLKCHFCTKSFHVTCAEKNGYWCFNKDAILACSNHAIITTTKTSPKRLAVAMEKWISKRDAFYLEQFDKTPKMFKIDVWKRVLATGGGVQQEAADLMDKSYVTFFDRIRGITESPARRNYTLYIEHLLSEFCRNYSSSYLLSVHGLFLKKNFYHSNVYRYVAPKGSFRICGDDEPMFTRPQPQQLEIPPAKKKKTGGDNITVYGNRRSTTPNNNNNKSTTVNNNVSSSSAKPSKPKPAAVEEMVVLPSPDLICTICNQHEFPQETYNKFNFGPEYLQHLQDTKETRKVGYTGTGNNWDPRVFIKCAVCHTKVHCGCPSPPIKKYPQKFQSFICIHCDTKGEEVNQIIKDDDHNSKRRGTTGINYKV